MALSPKQRLFLKNYLNSWNATQSAIKAGYSKKTAYSQGQRLLKNVEIKNAIASQLMTVEELGARLTEMARGERDDIEPNHELKAMELVGKMHGAFTEKREVEHSGSLQVEFVNDWRGSDEG